MEPKLVELPSFVPFEKIKICSNIIGAKYIFKIGNYIPMIIGKSDENKPLVWFYTRLKNGEILCVVDKNEQKHRQIECIKEENQMIFKIKKSDDTECVTFFKIKTSKWYTPKVVELDLRPFGLNIHADNDNLYIGNSCLKENVIIGSEVFFSI